jgi:hypothetical protein
VAGGCTKLVNKTILKLFQLEVERQCKFSLIAAQDLVRAHNDLDLYRFWYSVQALLLATANVSKLLWSGLPEQTAEELRKSLSIENDSPLKSRVFRNHFEHFGERLEKWALSDEDQNFIDSNIGVPNMLGGTKQEDYLRNFDPTRCAITFWGETYELQPVIEAIRKLLVLVSAENKPPASYSPAFPEDIPKN